MRNISLMVPIGLCLSGCVLRGTAGTPNPGPSSGVAAGLGQVLVFAGNWALYIGIGVFLVSIVGLIVSLTPWGKFLILFQSLFGETAVIGGITSIVGSMVAWVGVHSYLLWIVGIFATLIYAYRHRTELLKMWYGSKVVCAAALKVKPKP